MTQERALSILKTGGNVFLTGEPGAGKTHVVNTYVAWLEAAGLSVAVTASTGIAATHIGGMTIHAWCGIGARDELSRYDLDQILTKEKTVKRVRRAHVLIIDEISMIDGGLLDRINLVLKTIRQKNEPFGGLQVVFVGDFFQLPPVVKQGGALRYAFESHAWEAAQPLVCYLSEQYRHEDEMLLGLLSSLRKGEVEDEHFALLREQTDIAYEGVEPTRLYTHNADVDAVNLEHLGKLRGSARTFAMSGKGSKPLLEGLVRTCLSPETLVLKEDAMVMCTKNNFEAGFVNGTLGRIVGFADDGFPIMRTARGRDITIKPMTWEVAENGKVLAQIEQVPLRLAWAITVHKSQGMSLDAAEVDLSKAFVYGQGYVALSRVRTLAGLRVTGMNPQALAVDPKIVRHDMRLRSESDAAEDTFSTMDQEEIGHMHERFVVACGGKIPTDEMIASVSSEVGIKKESTFETTKKFLQRGLSVREIAKERDVAESTIWGHLEKLVEEREIAEGDLAHLLPDSWDSDFPVIQEACVACGLEKLKPIFERCNEQFDYESIRLARMVIGLRSRDLL